MVSTGNATPRFTEPACQFCALAAAFGRTTAAMIIRNVRGSVVKGPSGVQVSHRISTDPYLMTSEPRMVSLAPSPQAGGAKEAMVAKVELVQRLCSMLPHGA